MVHPKKVLVTSLLLAALGCSTTVDSSSVASKTAELRGGSCLTRPNVMFCGNSSRRGSPSLYSSPADAAVALPVVEVNGCEPDANTQLMFVTRSANPAGHGAAWRTYLQAGGRIATEYNISVRVYNEIYGTAYNYSGNSGSCQDNAMPAVKLTPGHPFWIDNDIPVTNAQACGWQLDALVAGEGTRVVPLGAWLDGHIQLAARDDGGGVLFLVESDWQDAESYYDDSSRRLMGAIVSACAGTCGDSVLQVTEGCDDGNLVDGDGCNATCKIEDTHACNANANGDTGAASCMSGVCDSVGNPAPGVCEAANVCGNGTIDAGESCDDGNLVDGDGCNVSCKIEDGSACGASGNDTCASGICDTTGNVLPGVCEPAGCGNGLLEAGEGCDDGNTDAADGCGATCKIETGEPCNDQAPGDLGSASCESTACNVLGGAPGTCVPAGICGNGVLEAGEGCDDGNTDAADGCNATCKIEDGSPCGATLPGELGGASCASNACDVRAGEPGSCVAAGCGNGVLEAGEGCDDGNTDAADGCNATCKIENGSPCGAGGDTSCASGHCDETTTCNEPPTQPDGGTSSSGGASSSGGSSSGGSSSGGSSSGGGGSSSSGGGGGSSSGGESTISTELGLSGGSGCSAAPSSPSAGSWLTALAAVLGARLRRRRAPRA